MAQSAVEKAWIEYLQAHGLATFDEIEAAQKAMQSPHDTLPDLLVRHNVITQIQRENIQKKLTQNEGGLTQLGSLRLTKKIGEGGMGAVYLAEDSMAGRTVAVKVLPKRFSSNPEFIARFRREARATGKLNHPNIVAAYSFGEEAGNHFYVMEYMSGAPLDSRLKNGSRLPWDEATNIVLQVAQGLQYAHDHALIHRDIKPANIFVADDGVAKILDLGLSKSIEESEQSFMTQSGTVLGTPHYISPEQARGDKGIDGRTDIYSLGATFYHLVTGRTPFDGSGAAVIMTKHLTEQLPNPLDFNPDLPDAVVQVLCKMMAKAADDRYLACADLIADLELILQGKAPSGAHLEDGKSSVAMRPVRAAASDAAKRMIHPHAPRADAAASQHKQRPKKSPVPLWLFGAVGGGIIAGILILKMFSGGPSPKPQPEPLAVAVKDTPTIPIPQPAPPIKEEPEKGPDRPPVKTVAEAKGEIIQPAPRGRTVDLLTLADATGDAVRGAWQKRAGNLLSDNTGGFEPNVGGARIELPYRPPDEYDFRVTFTRQSGQQCVALLFPAPPGTRGMRGTYAFIAGGWNNTLAGFEMVQAQGAHGPLNSTARRGNWLRTGQRQTLLLQVRRTGARAFLDGQEVTVTPQSLEGMQPAYWYALRDSTLLGVASWASPTAFHSIEIVELGNAGVQIRGEKQ